MIAQKAVILPLILALETPRGLFAQPNCIDYQSYINYYGTGIGPTEEIVIQGSLCFSIDQFHLTVHDFTDPSAPDVRSFFSPAQTPRAVAAQGDRAFLADDSSTLTILDYSSPSDPVVLGSLKLPEIAIDVVVRDGLAYAALGAAGLAIVDVDPPSSPQIVSVIDTPGSAAAIDLTQRFALVASESAGLVIIDVSDPQSPAIRGSVDTPGNCLDVVHRADFAYVADENADIHRIDISNAQAPIIVQSLALPGSIRSLEWFGEDHLYAAGEASGVQQLFVETNGNPVFEDLVLPYTSPANLEAFEDGIAVSYPYLLWSSAILRMGNQQTPAPVGSVTVNGSGGPVIVQDSFAYVSTGSGVYIFDVSDPEHPELLSSIDTPGYGGRAVLEQGLFYFADGLGLTILNVEDPAVPFLVSHTPIIGGSRDVAVWNDHAYVAAYSAGMRVFDVVDPAAPVFVGSWSSFGFTEQVEVREGFAYVTDHCSGGELGCFGFNVVDVHDPTSPTLVGAAGVGDCFNVLLLGDYALVNGLVVVDITNPQNPEIALYFGGHGGIRAIDGDLAYLLGSSEIIAVDISDPTSPTHLGQILNETEVAGIDVENGVVWAVTQTLNPEQWSLTAFPAQCSSAATGVPIGSADLGSLTVVPNPSRGAVSFIIEASTPGPIEVSIFDLQGRLVRQLRENAITPGQSIMKWDGRDSNQRPASPGVYFIQTATTSGISMTKATLLR